MRNKDDRNWELIGNMLAAESNGKSPRLFSSRKTLFGIPSALDQELQNLSKKAVDSKTDPKNATNTEKDSPAKNVLPDISAANKTARNPLRKNAKPNRVTHPLKPIFDDTSRILILGTMPSPKSRETGFYYNHPQNRFWKVMAALFDEPLPTTNDEKATLVLKHGIALWDVLAECTIEGAADGTIAECIPNDISRILNQAPVEAIYCTGAKATELYRKYIQPTVEIDCIRLPSTSPANASVSLSQLIESYRQLLEHCK